MSKKKVYFVRHGETVGNVERIFQFSDTPLTEAGHTGAQLVADRFREVAIDGLFASPFYRAQQTAQYIADVKNIPVQTLDVLHELVHSTEVQGVLRDSEQGLSYKKRYDQAFHDTTKDIGDAERFTDVIARIETVVLELEKSGHNDIAVVTHGNFLRYLTAFLLLHKTKEGTYIESVKESLCLMANAAITEFVFEDNKWKLCMWNDRAHFAE